MNKILVAYFSCGGDTGAVVGAMTAKAKLDQTTGSDGSMGDVTKGAVVGASSLAVLARWWAVLPPRPRRMPRMVLNKVEDRTMEKYILNHSNGKLHRESCTFVKDAFLFSSVYFYLFFN